MLDLRRELIEDTFASTLETLAFITPLPPEGPPAPPANAVLVRTGFIDSRFGAVELIAGVAFGRLLLANLLNIGPESPDSTEQAIDALKELTNVVCGRVLRKLSEQGAGSFQMGIPQAAPADLDKDWKAFLRDPSACVFDAEGNTLAVRINVKV